MISLKTLKSLSAFQRYVGLSVGLLAVGVVIGIKLTIPGFRQLFILKNDIAKFEQGLVLLSNKLNDLKTTSNSDIAMMADKYLLAIPQVNNYPALFDGIKSLANKNGVLITRLEISPGLITQSKLTQNRQKHYNQLSITAEISGSLVSIKQMVADLGNILPMVWVSDLSFEDKFSSDSASLAYIEAKMTVLSYWATLPAELDKVNAPLAKLTQDDYNLYSVIEKYTPLPVNSPYGYGGNQENIGRENPFPI